MASQLASPGPPAPTLAVRAEATRSALVLWTPNSRCVFLRRLGQTRAAARNAISAETSGSCSASQLFGSKSFICHLPYLSSTVFHLSVFLLGETRESSRHAFCGILLPCVLPVRPKPPYNLFHVGARSAVSSNFARASKVETVIFRSGRSAVAAKVSSVFECFQAICALMRNLQSEVVLLFRPVCSLAKMDQGFIQAANLIGSVLLA